jgi:hypothetical protein
LSRSYAKRGRACGKSDADDKRFAHKAQRAMEHNILAKIEQEFLEEDDAIEFADERTTSNTWNWSSDGSTGMYISPENMEKWFDENKYDKNKKLLRK